MSGVIILEPRLLGDCLEGGINMTWNYRIMRQKEVGIGFTYAIHEVYYDGEKPISVSEEPCSILSEELEGLPWVLEKIHDALKKPVLDFWTLQEVQ